jgi:hypothetical protein
MTTFRGGSAEAALWRVVPRVIGGLVLVEASAGLMMAVFIAILGGLVTSLAFLGGAGGATDKQVSHVFHMVGLTLATPFLLVGILGVSGVLLILRTGRAVVISGTAICLLAQLAFHLLTNDSGLHPADLVPLTIQLAAMGVAIALPRTALPAKALNPSQE